MAVSRLTEKPAGRRPIATSLHGMRQLPDVVAGIARALDRGARVFWVCPQVTESEATDIAAAETRFADGYPILIIGQASLDDLNARLARAGREQVPMNRFRPNLVVDGLEAFEEDFVESFSTNDLALRPVKPCARCPIPAIDQATGIAGPDPLDILQSYRANPRMDGAVCMGMNCIVSTGAGNTLAVGDELAVALAF